MKNLEVQIGKIDQTEVLFGQDRVQIKARRPYSGEICRFLAALSKTILDDAEAKKYTDIAAFGFYIRRSNISGLANKHQRQCQQLGRGLIFHIAPSNVPVNFAYTFLFGLLAGNSNIVRISSKHFTQYEIICRLLNQVSDADEFSWVRQTNAVVRYERDNHMTTDYFSSVCDARVIWGGDSTIDFVRRSPIPPRTTEITFSDRYSIAMLAMDVIESMSDDTLKKLAQDFYNDTYLMDQNACSSPHLIIWCQTSSSVLSETCEDKRNVWDSRNAHKLQKRFWRAVYEAAGKYELEDMKASEKYTALCEGVIRYDIAQIEKYSNVLYTVYLKSLPEDITDLRGKFGLFYNCNLDSIEQILGQLNSKKIQTIAVVGIDKKKLSDYVVSRGISGVDRIVSVGKTLDIDVIWDGYNIISALSRNISF